MNNTTMDLKQPKYFNLLGRGNALARFSLQNGQVRIIRVDKEDNRFVIHDRIPYDFDYQIQHDPKWYPMQAAEFYATVHDGIRNMQLIIKQ